MGFFAEFNLWLNALLTGYIAANTARMAAALEPAILTLGTLYTLIWGFLHLTGKLERPFVDDLKKLITLAVILGCSLRLWLYNDAIVDTFFNAPGQLAAAIVGADDSVSVVDQIIFAGGDAANLLLQKAGIFDGEPTYYLAGFIVYVIVGLTAVYTIFLLSLARIALSVLLALGPLFIALYLFESTKRFSEAWLAQLANYGLLAILTVVIASLMLQLLSVAAEQAVSAGGNIQIAHAARVSMAAGLTFLVMLQVSTMAASLANGLALGASTALTLAAAWALGRTTKRVAGVALRGTGVAGAAVGRGVKRVVRHYRPNTISSGART